MDNPRLPHVAEVIERTEESPNIFTLRLRFADPQVHLGYHFTPGQFNMLYLPEVGEVAISIVSGPDNRHTLDHTIRAVGRVTNGLQALKVGQQLGIRGPYGRGWPMEEALGRDVVVITGGLGCAPVVAAINHVLHHRSRYGRLVIMQGVRHSHDLIWAEQYRAWEQEPDTQVLLAASEAEADWPWHVGRVPVLFDKANLDIDNSLVMMCGPEGMMKASAEELLRRQMAPERIHVSLERNMKCGVGRCGHCQLGGKFVCQDGPVFPWTEVSELLAIKGL